MNQFLIMIVGIKHFELCKALKSLISSSLVDLSVFIFLIFFIIKSNRNDQFLLLVLLDVFGSIIDLPCTFFLNMQNQRTGFLTMSLSISLRKALSPLQQVPLGHDAQWPVDPTPVVHIIGTYCFRCIVVATQHLRDIFQRHFENMVVE